MFFRKMVCRIGSAQMDTVTFNLRVRCVRPSNQREISTWALATTLIMATTSIEVQIYLPIHAQVASVTEWIHVLSIPRQDIERLTLRPLKWLRFATFTVCGTKGDFSATQGGETVNYENVSFNNLADKYYYTPDSKLVLPTGTLSISSSDVLR